MGWQAFQASCYKLTPEKTDWQTAQKTCQKMEANLVSIHTLPELEFITSTVKRGDSGLVFVSPSMGAHGDKTRSLRPRMDGTPPPIRLWLLPCLEGLML